MGKTYFYLIILILGYSCDYNFQNNNTEENILKDSLRLDSLRIIKCDSLLSFITKTNSGNIDLPDTYPKNIDECIIQLDTCTNDTIKDWIKCVTEIEYLTVLHHGFGMYLRNNWGLWGKSELTKHFNSLGIFHPDDMSSIILECFHQFINTKNYSVEEKTEYYINYWNKIKAREDSINRINKRNYKKTKKFIDSLHKAINYDGILNNVDGLVNDSLNFYIKRIKGDTSIFWISGGYSRLTKEKYLNITNHKRFGKTLFFGSIREDGYINDLSLKRRRFVKKGKDLLYEEGSGGFVKIFTNEMIHVPSIVNQWKPVSDCSYYKSFVKTQWVLNGKKYFCLQMQGDCRGTGLSVNYYIDDDLNIIFDQLIQKKLQKSKILFKTDSL